MSNARNLADLLDSTGDVKSTSLDNVPASDDASALTTGTLPDGRFPSTLPAVSGANLTGIETVTKSTTAPASPAQGDMWFDTTTGTTAMKVWSGSEWNQMSNKFSATGGTISTSGGYKYHTFTSSGTFTAEASGSVDYLLVAGGGSGGGSPTNQLYENSGGGGGGGYISGTGLAVFPQAYTITIGAGGTGPSNGGSTSGVTLTAVGGGTGGGNYVAATSGGSGGGGSAWGLMAGASGTSGQGNAGGTGTNTPTATSGAGGGGGHGSVGGSASSSTGGTGGSGTNWENLGTFYAAGGGGSGATAGAGGSSIGGRGAYSTVAAAGGVVNSGAGGGGAYCWGGIVDNGGNGGSGIVIIRYAV